MTISFYRVLTWLLAGIVVIILLTTKYKVHAFFTWIPACFVTGPGIQLPLPDIGPDIKSVLRVYSIATLWMALVSLLMVYLLSFILT